MSNFNVWKAYAAKSCCYFTNMNGFSYILSDWFLHEHSTSQGILDDKDRLLLQLAIFLLLFLVIAGAWLGFWVVHKLVLAEDGSIDIGVSHFVAWSIRFIASALILQVSIYMIILRIHLILQSSHFLFFSIPYQSSIGHWWIFICSSEFCGSFIVCWGMDIWSSDLINLEEIMPSQICSALFQVSQVFFFFKKK